MCLFTVEAAEELQSASIHVRRAEVKSYFPDEHLLAIRIADYRREKALEFDGGNEEIDAVTPLFFAFRN